MKRNLLGSSEYKDYSEAPNNNDDITNNQTPLLDEIDSNNNNNNERDYDTDPFDSQYEYRTSSSISSEKNYSGTSSLHQQRSGGNISNNNSSNNNYSNPNLVLTTNNNSVHNMPSTEFDRYPNRISVGGTPFTAGGGGRSSYYAPSSNGGGGPRVTRGNEIIDDNNAATNTTTNDYSTNTSSSINEKGDALLTNPFVVTTDFSPFGGYPASSFPLLMEEKEGDDHIHNPDPIKDADMDRRCQGLDRRGWLALAGLVCLGIGAILLFIVLPVLTYSGLTERKATTEVVEHLSDYEYGILSAIRTDLVDPDTPRDAQHHKSKDGDSWDLVFSDEFNKEGRTFYEGDDQFWTAMDFWYSSTMDLEWYSPDAVTTEKGTLVLTLDAYKNHDVFYRSGMVQSWNQLCFTQGYIEVSALLPGEGQVNGLWPGIWTLGNLGRPGYRASTEGVWPYTYEACDSGITPNQSSPDGISYLPGQKLNSCTCKGHDHPNEGTGRGAPEIDLIEAQQDQKTGKLKNGQASQSYQVAPFDIWYYPNYDFIEIHNKSVTVMNTYTGGPIQQAVSAASTLNHDWYEKGVDTPSYQSYGYEYLNDNSDGYIRWFIGDDPTATLYAPAIGPNGNIGQRVISKEPMSIIMNLGLSNNWDGNIAWGNLHWPSKMRIDYVRVYQPPDKKSLTCDPSEHPTYDYIQDHLPAYMNVNHTSWEEAGYAFPPNRLSSDCD